MEGGTREPRLMITRIVNENFKSYAGVKELGIFHKNFTAIVGPNGSGKSNVIDALLFVFGYRARKIRSKKLSVLIHNSDQHQNIPSCTVSIYFQQIIDLSGDNDYEVVPDSQIVVSRTAYRDNSSVYHLDGKKVLFRDVAALLRQSGIDLDHNRFLILQGEVEHIALLKPKAQTEHDDGMLEFLEDIIGSSQYKEPIELLAKQVEEFNEARGEKLNRVKVVEKEKDDLEDAKREAEEYLAMKNDVAKKQFSLYQRYIYECSRNENKSKEKKEQLDTGMAELKSTLTDHKGVLNQRLDQHNKRLEAHDTLVARKEKCKAGLTACEQQDIKSRQALKNSKSSLKKAHKNLEKEREKLQELESSPAKHSAEIEQIDKKIKSLEEQKGMEEEKLSEVLSSLSTCTKDLQVEKEECEKRLIPLKQSVNSSESKLNMARAELDIYEEQYNGSQRKLQEAIDSKQKMVTEKGAKRSELDSTRELIAVKKTQLTKAEEELKGLSESENRLSDQLRNARLQVEETRSALHGQKSRGRILESLMQQCKQGYIPGFYGRLGDLGTIDEKYDVAISTACGSLDHMVVDTMQTAMKCVEYLKKHNIGSTTFIALDKIQRWKQHASKKAAAMPESIPRLFDLVRAKDQKFSTAFYFVLRDTLVAKDLNQATRVGLQGRTRHRVVTLGGALVDQSGTMSGGGTRVARGKMSSKLQVNVTPQQLKELESKMANDELSFTECTERKKTLTKLVEELTAELSRMEKDCRRAEMDLQLLCEQEKAIEDQIKEFQKQKSEIKLDPKRLAKLKKQVDVCLADYNKSMETASEVETDFKRLQDRIMEVGGSRVQQQQAKLDVVVKEMELLSNTVTKARVAIKTAERNGKKCMEKITTFEKEIQKGEKKIETTKDELSSLETEAKTIVAEQEALIEKFQEVDGELLEMKEEISKLEEEQRVTEDKMLDLKHEQEKYIVMMKENQQKIKYYRSEVKKLNLQESDMVELTHEELESLDRETIEFEITTLEEKLKMMQPNMSAIDEYKQKEQLYMQRAAELEHVTTERDTARREHDDKRKQRLDCFMAGFIVITTKLKEMYQMITLGGDAELELVDSLDPFSEGIVFSVRPPQKSWKNISNLSGGEKTLSSLALVFALHHYKPSPLYVMDEIDAALDFKNVSIVANYIKERTKNAQFIIISLRSNMFELADCLVGIYKTHDATKSVTIHPKKIVAASERQPLTERNQPDPQPA